MLVRYLGLRPPPCYRIAMTPRPGRAGVLHLSEGDVVVFGFKEDNPWSTSEEDSSDQEDQAESEAAPDHSSDVSVLDDEHATPPGSVTMVRPHLYQCIARVMLQHSTSVDLGLGPRATPLAE